MLKVRRPDHESRIEIMPLIDVIFLLLTFFIYAMVMMIRAELLPIEMQAFASGEPAKPAPAVTVSIDEQGKLFVDRDPIKADAIIERLQDAKRRDPDTVIYVASEAKGSTDRLPIFLDLYDRLALAGLDIKLVGKPKEEGE
ncbi:MAG: biopolymer transporter ExbD [Planctomycetes bacterium]|nr:biopolymer transporter ExbD [Planctomycetota bacterium]